MPLSALESMQLDDVLEHVNVPSYVLDTAGVIRSALSESPAGERSR